MASPRPDVTIVTTGHDVADARLHRIVAALRRRSLTVELCGLGDPAGAPPGATVRSARRGGMRGRAARALVWPWRASGRVVLTCDPDSAPATYAACRLRRRRWVADVHEDYVALLRDRAWVRGGMRPALQLVTALLVRVQGRADLTVVADEHVPPSPARSRQRLVVRNLPDFTMLPERVATSEQPLRALYVGDLRPSRGLREMLDAAQAATDWSVDLVGPMSAADQAWLASRVDIPGLTDRVRWHGRMPPVAAWAFARDAQVGLCLLDDTPAFRDSLPSKVYEYLACGLAVVATPLPRVRELIDRSGGGAVVPDGAQAGALLQRWSADRGRLAQAQAAARAWGERERRDGNDYDELAARVEQLAREPRDRSPHTVQAQRAAASPSAEEPDGR